MKFLPRWTAADWATFAVLLYILWHVSDAFACGRFPIVGGLQ